MFTSSSECTYPSKGFSHQSGICPGGFLLSNAWHAGFGRSYGDYFVRAFPTSAFYVLETLSDHRAIYDQNTISSIQLFTSFLLDWQILITALTHCLLLLLLHTPHITDSLTRSAELRNSRTLSFAPFLPRRTAEPQKPDSLLV